MQTAVTGRVTTPAGAPVGGATVQLIYGEDPHWPESVPYEGLTDNTGVFNTENVVHWQFLIVVRGNGGARTYDAEWSEAGGYEPIDVWVAPTQAVQFSAHCATTLPHGVHDEPLRAPRRWSLRTDPPHGQRQHTGSPVSCFVPRPSARRGLR